MNERIRELAEQANEAFHNRMGEGADKGTFYFDGFAEKFAELIVQDIKKELSFHTNNMQECIEDKSTDYQVGWADGMYEAEEMICLE